MVVITSNAVRTVNEARAPLHYVPLEAQAVEVGLELVSSFPAGTTNTQRKNVLSGFMMSLFWQLIVSLPVQVYILYLVDV